MKRISLFLLVLFCGLMMAGSMAKVQLSLRT